MNHGSFHKREQEIPVELQDFWQQLSIRPWQNEKSNVTPTLPWRFYYSWPTSFLSKCRHHLKMWHLQLKSIGFPLLRTLPTRPRFIGSFFFLSSFIYIKLIQNYKTEENKMLHTNLCLRRKGIYTLIYTWLSHFFFYINMCIRIFVPTNPIDTYNLSSHMY